MQTIPAPSLKGNLLGDAAEQEIAIYLPPSYDKSKKNYPVIYFLTGYGDGTSVAYPLLRDSLDKHTNDGSLKEMIAVTASGVNRLDGSFYVNSPITGNWEDFIFKDVVGYVDAHYRTIPKAGGRGIAGHSMGGFGALNLAMRHPDVFGSVYSLSPGLFDPDGLANSQMFATQDAVDSFLKAESTLASMPKEEAKAKLASVIGRNWDLEFALAYGAAFSPNPAKNPPYINYPYRQAGGQPILDKEVWKVWDSGFGGIPAKLKLYKQNLLSLKGIVIDYGTHDEYQWIPQGCRYFSQQMDAEKIPNKLVSFEGGHQDQLRQRIEKFMLPYFSEKLIFEN